MRGLQGIATVGLTVAATLVAVRALKPPVVYCDACDAVITEMGQSRSGKVNGADYINTMVKRQRAGGAV